MPEKKKILVVEDEKPLRRVLAKKLTIEGFSVSEAAEGKSGLEMALREHPDLILLDVIMPKMGGKEVLAELQKDSWGKSVPIIFLTNLSDPVKIAEISESSSRHATVFDYLIKSDWKLEEVVEKVRSNLGMK